MHAETHIALGWIGILILAGFVTLIIAAVKHPAVRPWLFGAFAFVAAVIFLRALAMPAGHVVRQLDGAGHVMTHNVASNIKGVGFLAVLALVVGAALFSSRRHGGHIAGVLIVGMLLSVFLLGLTWTQVRDVTVRSTPTTVEVRSGWPVMPTPPVHPAAEPPIDELWMQQNEPQIQLTPTPADPSAPVETAPNETPPSASAPAQAEAEDSVDAESAAEAAADESVTESVAATAATDAAHAEHDHADDSAPDANEVSAATARPRPEWIDQTPRMVGEVYRVPVKVGPYTSLDECATELRGALSTAVHDRVVELVREATGEPYVFVPSLDEMNIGNSYIARELLTDQYEEDFRSESMGAMKNAYGLLEFTAQQDQQLVEAWKGHARREGIHKTTVLASVVLAVLGSVFALLKIDTWTRGYYTKRLFIGVPAAIIAVITLIAMAGH